jgi:hypothetical protein
MPQQQHCLLLKKDISLEADIYGGAYLLFADKFGGDLTQKDIAGQTKLGVGGCAAGSKIFQFTLYVKKNGRTTKFVGDTNTLTPAMHKALKNLSPGDEFSFKHVKARLPKKGGAVDVWAKPFYVIGRKA